MESQEQAGADVVPLFDGGAANRDKADQTVTWIAADTPKTRATHERILEILFDPYPDRRVS